jgi:hypothetical protein
MLNYDMNSTTGGHSWTTMTILHDRPSVIAPHCSHSELCGLFIFLSAPIDGGAWKDMKEGIFSKLVNLAKYFAQNSK